MYLRRSNIVLDMKCRLVLYPLHKPHPAPKHNEIASSEDDFSGAVMITRGGPSDSQNTPIRRKRSPLRR